MKAFKTVSSLFCALIYQLCVAVGKPCDGFNGVSTFIGSGGPAYGYGGVNPGAQYPFSPLRLGPDTNNGKVYFSLLIFNRLGIEFRAQLFD